MAGDDRKRQAAVDKRGYYDKGDIANAKRDPKVRANFRSLRKRSGGKRR